MSRSEESRVPAVVERQCRKLVDGLFARNQAKVDALLRVSDDEGNDVVAEHTGRAFELVKRYAPLKVAAYQQ